MSVYIYEIGKTRLYETTNYTIFFCFTCYVYLSFQSLTLLDHKYIAYKPFKFLQSDIISLFFTIFLNNWFLWKCIINYSCLISSAHINSYLSNIATGQSKDHKALRLLRKSPICIAILIHFKYIYVHINEIALSNKILTIYIRHTFKYAYSRKHRCWTFEYRHTK